MCPMYTYLLTVFTFCVLLIRGVEIRIQALTSVRHLYCSGACLRKVPEQGIRKVLWESRVLT